MKQALIFIAVFLPLFALATNIKHVEGNVLTLIFVGTLIISYFFSKKLTDMIFKNK